MLSLYGYTTKRDLSAISSFLIMGFWGVFIALIVNMFLQSTMLDKIISIYKLDKNTTGKPDWIFENQVVIP